MNKLMFRDLNMKQPILALSLLITAMALSTFACSSGTANLSFVTNADTNSNASVEPAGTPMAGSAEDQSRTAEALVIELYKQHDAQKSPFFQTKNRALVDKYFTRALADLIWKDANNTSGGVGAIDADPLYNTQDPDIKNFAVGKASVTGASASVPVTFTNGGRKENLAFSLRQVKGAWKIDDIKYSESDSLMKWLKETYPEEPTKSTVSTGEFDGKFQVGDTTCTVKPVKMAFEVRWAKGSGIEMFAFTEGNSFESAPGSNDSNKFVFDDENYNTGKFYRADGKVFAVKRAR